VKVRIGLSTGTQVLEPEALAGLADALADLRFDSLWIPDILTVPGYDPLVGLAWASGRNPALKIGTTMLLPGRNLVRLAKQVATLDTLSGGNFLLTFVPGIPRGSEVDAVGVDRAARGAVMDDALPVLRRLWAGETVTHDGPAGHLRQATVTPRPVQDPFDVWLGGMVPAALRRCGRLSDGWLPSLCTPEEVAAGRKVVEAAAEEAGRAISPEHFGVSIAYTEGPLDGSVAPLAALARGRPVADLVPAGLDALRDMLLRFLDVGFSKFVVRPVRPTADGDAVGGWGALERLADAVGDLQT
jgi:probable F420-dependent oxidoreductase